MSGHKNWSRRTALAAAMGAMAWMSSPVLAQDVAGWPKQPIKMLIGFAAGGGNDVFGRMVAQRLSEKLGQPVVVENKPSAGSILAYELTARAVPDGYTLLIAPFGATIINPAVYDKLPYDPAALQPLSIMASFPFVMVVRADLPVNSIAELVAYAKANPDKANYGTPSVTFQLLVEQFKAQTGAPFEHIPYKSTAEVLTGVLNGQLMMSFVDPGPLAGHLKGGRVKAFAQSGSKRFAPLPDIPTMAEAGFPGIEMDSFMGVMAPRGLPDPIARKLEDTLIEMTKETEFAGRVANHSLVVVGSTAAQFAERVARDIPVWKTVAQKAKIKLD